MTLYRNPARAEGLGKYILIEMLYTQCYSLCYLSGISSKLKINIGLHGILDAKEDI